MVSNFFETGNELPPVESFSSAFQRRWCLGDVLIVRSNGVANVKVHVVDSNTFIEIDEMLINLEDFRKYLRYILAKAKVPYLVTIVCASIGV